jgi:hypothetical protein
MLVLRLHQVREACYGCEKLLQQCCCLWMYEKAKQSWPARHGCHKVKHDAPLVGGGITTIDLTCTPASIF